MAYLTDYNKRGFNANGSPKAFAVNSNRCFEHGIHGSFCIDASELGLPVGRFPKYIEFDGVLTKRGVHHDDGTIEYELGGATNRILIIWND